MRGRARDERRNLGQPGLPGDGVRLPDLVISRVYAAVVSDILDELGHRDHTLDPAIRPLGRGAVIAGPANPFLVTEVHQIPAEPYTGEIGALDDIRPGEVVLVAAGGSARAACWGELFSTAAIYRHPPAPLSVQLPASDASCLALLRAELRQWLSAAGIGGREATDIMIAVGEAAANAFEHATAGRPADAAPVQIALTARAAHTMVQLTVADTGNWRSPLPTPSSLPRAPEATGSFSCTPSWMTSRSIRPRTGPR